VTPATVVLVHGAWHGPWCWERVTPHLESAGVPWLAVDRRMGPDHDRVATTVEDNTRLLGAALDGLGAGPVVLVGHSAGGRVITWGVAGRRDVAHLVYLAAFMPGGDVAERPSEAVNAALRTDAAGSFDIAPGALYDLFYGPDVSAADAAWAASQLVPQAPGDRRSQPNHPPAWRSIPSTYVVCRRDGAIPADYQEELAAQAGEVVRWDAGHSPFLSRPAEVADLLVTLATRHGR
jgi:pimeloyl-ACP methyl ester carboxylesterase